MSAIFQIHHCYDCPKGKGPFFDREGHYSICEDVGRTPQEGIHPKCPMIVGSIAPLDKDMVQKAREAKALLDATIKPFDERMKVWEAYKAILDSISESVKPLTLDPFEVETCAVLDPERSKVFILRHVVEDCEGEDVFASLSLKSVLLKRVNLEGHWEKRQEAHVAIEALMAEWMVEHPRPIGGGTGTFLDWHRLYMAKLEGLWKTYPTEVQHALEPNGFVIQTVTPEEWVG